MLLYKNSIHEINHLNQEILFFKGNDINLFFRPKGKNLKGEDGGTNLEEILLKDFKKNFENLIIIILIFLKK